MLRQILKEFETASGPVSINALSRKLGVDRATLELMLDYWVRQGRLQDNKQFVMDGEASCSAKGSCGAKCQGVQGCSFLASMPKAYTLVTDKRGHK